MTASEVTTLQRSGRRKVLLRVMLLLAVAAAGLLVLGTFGSLLSTVTQSGDAAEVFTDAAELPDDLLDAVTWLPDTEGIPRSMEPLTRADVTSAWIRAWSQLTVAAETGDTSGMEVYFSNSALQGVLAGAESSSNRPVFQIGHDLQLTFYSEDGQVVGLTAVQSRLLRAEPFDDGVRRFFESEESFEAVLILEDGNWRIQHWVRQSVEGDWLVGAAPLPTDEVIRLAELGPSVVDVRLAGLSAAAPDVPVVGVVDVVGVPTAAEISMTLNGAESKDAVLRIPVGFDEVGGSTPTAEMLDVIVKLLDIAGDQDRKVVLSLFEGRVDFRPSRWEADRRQLTAIREAVNGHPALVSVEVANLALGLAPMQSDLFDAWMVSMGRSGGTANPAVAGSMSDSTVSVGRSTE